METDPASVTLQSWLQSSERFDYFMAGLCSALTAYLGQGFTPTRIGLNPATAELASLAVLCASVVAAFTRIELQVRGLGAMHQRLYHQAAAGALVTASQEGRTLLNITKSEYVSPNDALEQADSHSEAGMQARAQTRDLVKRSEAAYRWRNRLLFAGFLILLAARIWRAYTG